MEESRLFSKVYGCLLGGLIGDAMGAPVENWTWQDIENKYGELSTFSGAGTDDSAVKQILCDVLIQHDGHITGDEFAMGFMENPQYYNLYFIPVRNMYHKLKDHLAAPREAGCGNMQSSSSAMAISPMGIVNACNPRQAATETFDVASIIHSGSTAFCCDAACAMAAAVAQAMMPETTVDEVLQAATKYLHSKSAELMINKIENALNIAKEVGEYRIFRERYYASCLEDVICDSRETVPAAFAIFYLAQGDPKKSILFGVNFGRDADTIASMVGALAGAYGGVEALEKSWIEQIERETIAHKDLAHSMTKLVTARALEMRKMADAILDV